MDDDKQSGATSLGSGDFNQNRTNANHPSPEPAAPLEPPLPPPPIFNRSSGNKVPEPHELTAEWTVRAQLTFTRAGENVRKEFNHSDPVHPVKVIYKWSTYDSPSDDGLNIANDNINDIDNNDDDDDDDDDDDENFDHDDNDNDNDKINEGECHETKDNSFKKKLQKQQNNTNLNRESFRSTTSSTNPDNGGGDSAFSGSNTSRNQNRSYYINDNVKQKNTNQNKKSKTKSKTKTKTKTSTTTNIGCGDDTNPSFGIHYGTRCRSTCNIIVTAVADFLPSSSNNTSFNSRGVGSSSHQSIPEEPDPFVFNTTASYTVLPQKSIDETNLASKNFSTFGKILDLRDAICQTSDPEITNYHELKVQKCSNDGRCDDINVSQRHSPIHLQQQQQQQQQQQKQQKRKFNEYNRTMERTLLPTESLLDEGNSFSPSFMSSSAQTFKSTSLPRIPSLPLIRQSSSQSKSKTITQSQSQSLEKSKEQQKKQPRTVHIDVYCTGSDEDDDADNDATSSASSPGILNPHEIESNSTQQTVLNTEQMLLRHQRISDNILPRRMILNEKSQQNIIKDFNVKKKSSKLISKSDEILNFGHGITKSNTIDEINESKQLLLRKHVGDQRAIKLQNLRSKYLRKDASDDCLSSNYPNSSRSTIRDATCSSISSVLQSPALTAIETPTVTPTTATTNSNFLCWKEIDDLDDSKCSLTKSDSFDYDNSVDRLRIKEMEKFWSQTENNFPIQTTSTSKILQPISEIVNSSIKTINEIQSFDLDENDSYQLDGKDKLILSSINKNRENPRVFSPKPSTPTNLDPSTFLHYFGPQQQQYQQQHQQQQHHPLFGHLRYRPIIQRWRNDVPDTPSSISDDTNTSNSPTKRCGSETRFIEKKFNLPIQSNEAPPAILSGYTQEYLQKARIFGSVIQIIRKPGHHIGPTKNPHCLCGSCQRWLANRIQMRSRSHSVGEKN